MFEELGLKVLEFREGNHVGPKILSDYHSVTQAVTVTQNLLRPLCRDDGFRSYRGVLRLEGSPVKIQKRAGTIRMKALPRMNQLRETRVTGDVELPVLGNVRS
ncbi:MAG: hypothetical protein WDM89_13430 [Rhizomicrobium sp.]